MRKGFSLGFNQGIVNDLNSYTRALNGIPDNGELIKAGNNKWVKFFVNWEWLQGSYKPSNIYDSWYHLRDATKCNWDNLDASIKAANDDGLGVILCVDAFYPRWSNDTAGDTSANFEPLKTGVPRREAKAAVKRLPDDVTTNGPWGWFIGNLFARYKRLSPGITNGDATHNGPDPQGLQFGNRAGAWVNAIEFVNEPNFQAWHHAFPQYDANGSKTWVTDSAQAQNLLVCRVAQMFQTADYYSYGFAGPAVLGPATLDVMAEPSEKYPYDVDWFDYADFTARVVNGLNGWVPRAYVGWSMHSYGDVKYGGTSIPRTKIQRGWLDLGNFKGPAATAASRWMWITETGFDVGLDRIVGVLPDRDTPQRDLVVRHYMAVAGWGQAYVAMTHSLHDRPGANFYSGCFDSGLNGNLGAQRKLWGAWQQLPADTTP